MARVAVRTILLVGSVALGSVAAGVTGLSAGASSDRDRNGDITGTVTDASTTLPISGIPVQLFTSTGAFQDSVSTNASGDYMFSNQPDGTYFVVAMPFSQNYVAELYDSIPCTPSCTVTSGTPVVVAGGTIGSIDFALTPGATITGTVTDGQTGLPIAGIGVQVYLSTGASAGGATTNASGVYSVNRLPGGTYLAHTRTTGTLNYLDEIYDDIPCPLFCNSPQGGMPFVVPASGTKSGVDFALSRGGTISGTVTDAVSQTPLASVFVEIYDAAGGGVATVPTSASGTYEAVRLRTGNYYARTWASSAGNYFNKLYDDVVCVGFCAPTTGTPIGVIAGMPTAGIDFGLSAGGVLSGTVTDAGSGTPLSSGGVSVFTTGGGFVAAANVSGAGQYSVTGLPTGTYVAQASATGFVPELYDNVLCQSQSGCPFPLGTPIAITSGTTSTGFDFALSADGRLTGTVRDEQSGLAIDGDDVEIEVHLYNSTGTEVDYTYADANGVYEFDGLPTGSYFVRLFTFEGYVDELYNDTICLGIACPVTTGTPVAVTAGVTTSGIDFDLAFGGSIAGTIANAMTLAPLAAVEVQVYSSTGQRVKTSARSSQSGGFSIVGLPAGTYYARTANSTGFLDEIFDNQLLCGASCLPTTGTPITVTVPGTTTVDFALTPGIELLQNGDFSDGTNHWGLFALPTMGHIVSQTPFGVFQFYRVPAPAGTPSQAVILQETGVSVPADTQLVAQFDIGNTSPLRRRISVLLHDANFSDLSVCTFWLQPEQLRTRYGIRARTTTPWTNVTISFYAASADTSGGFYEIDNVSLQAPATPLDARADCIDPIVPPASGGAAGPTLLVNGDFSAGLTGWGLFGQIIQQVINGVFEFVRPAGTPSGVILQGTGAQMASGEIITATFSLGNSSAVRKRVTVLLHEGNFSDLTACTFWLPPGQQLAGYAMKTFTTKAWTNATISIYPATIGLEQWIQLDDVTMRRVPGTPITGTECVEPPPTDAGRTGR